MTSKASLLVGTILVALLLGATAVAQNNPIEVPVYQASYSVGYGSLKAGDTSFTLTRNPDGTYTYKSLTKPAGLASLFFDDTITEISHFRVHDGELQALRYTYEDSGKDKDEKREIQFDWVKGVAHTTDDGKHKSLPVKPGTYDRLLAQLAISMDLAKGEQVENYPIVLHNEVSDYHMLRQDNTDLKTPAGNYETWVIARRDQHSNRVLKFWLAPKLDYLPVQIEQTEPGKTTFSWVLTDIHFNKYKSGN